MSGRKSVTPYDDVRDLIATMLRLPPEEVGPETPLAPLDHSLGGARLKLGLKRLGLPFPYTSLPATFGELDRVLSGNAAPIAIEAEPSDSPAAGALQIGLDAQDVRALPVASDYWEHESYAGVFAQPEIAYAVRQSEPRTHLAGFWSAKEALRKCDPAFAKVEMAAIVVIHDPDGKPHLARQTASGLVRLPHVLSLSHTGDLAMAVVIKLAAPPVRLDSPPAPFARPRSRLVSLSLFLVILAGFIYLLIERLRGI